MNENTHPEDFDANEPFLLISVGREVGNLSEAYPADVYSAAQGWWTMNPGDMGAGYLVLARDRERVIGVFRTKSWRESPLEDSTGRWGFIGEPAEISAQLRYMGKRVPQQYRTGSNPIRYGPDPD